ncbi:deoxynucleoside kinase [Mycoplasmopsis gallinarum]
MLIGISGMISSGKSTLAKGLVKYFNNSILLEEFEEDDPIFNTFLKWMYQNEPNINIAFQTYIIENLEAKLQKTIEEAKTKKIDYIFLDRFNLEHYIFAFVTLKNKPLKYLKAFDALFHELVNKNENPDLAIFLDIDFATFKKRLFKRNRKSEIVNYEKNEVYFKELHSLYKLFYIKLMQQYEIPYFIINTNGKNNEEVLDEAIDLIENFKTNKKSL